eukprot:IDg12939t1
MTSNHRKASALPTGKRKIISQIVVGERNKVPKRNSLPTRQNFKEPPHITLINSQKSEKDFPLTNNPPYRTQDAQTPAAGQ